MDDCRGVPVTAPDANALESFEQALVSLYSYRHDPLALITPVIEQWPGFALAHILKALVLVNLTERRFSRAAAASLEQARPLLDGLHEREVRLFQAAAALIAGQLANACAHLEANLIDHPRDILSLHTAHTVDFFRGDATSLRNRVARVIPEWHEGVTGYANVLAMQAFGLEECNEYAAAMDAGHRALAAETKNPWAVHAVAHVLEMRGEVEAGIEHLRSRSNDWAPDSGFSYHNWWHLALFHLDQDQTDEVLELYDARLNTPEASFALSKLDAAALLWRLQLFEVPVGQRWQPVAAWWREQLADGTGLYAFNDFHAALAFVASGEHHLLEQLRQTVLSSLDTDDGDLRRIRRQVGLPLIEALVSYAQARYADAAEQLAGVREVAHLFGGSHAQRDLVTLTLISAAAKAGNRNLARHYLNERLIAKPASPLGWRLQQQLIG